MIKFSKNLLLNPATIRVSGLDCSVNNIIKIVDLFNCKEMVVTIDSATEESSLPAFIKAQGLKYFERPRSAEHAEISVIIPPPLFGDFLDKAIYEAPENVFVFSLRDPANAGMCLRHSYEELVTKGIVDVFISISFDENVLLICMNKSLVSLRDVYPQIKALHLH